MRCAYCHEPLSASDAVRCARCRTTVHGECAALHGRCVTLACPGTDFQPAPARAGREALRCRVSLRRHLERAAHRVPGALVQAGAGHALALAAALGLLTLGGLCLTSAPESRAPIPPLSRIR